MEINEAEAQLISTALAVFNGKLVEEFEKIANTPDVSELLVKAAHAQYNATIEDYSKLHIKLVTTFPTLTQGQAVTLD